VREAILEHPYWAVPGRDGTILMYGRTFAGRYLLVVTIAEGGRSPSALWLDKETPMEPSWCAPTCALTRPRGTDTEQGGLRCYGRSLPFSLYFFYGVEYQERRG
jgi:hypothetical protein